MTHSEVERWKLVRVLLPDMPEITPMEIQISQANEVHVIGSKKAELGDTLLESPFVSRKHCQLVFRNKYWYLQDLTSLNGTYLNGESIECERELRENDKIGLGVGEILPNLEPPLSKYYIFQLIKYCRKVESSTSKLPFNFSKKIPVITLDDDAEEDVSSALSTYSNSSVSTVSRPKSHSNKYPGSDAKPKSSDSGWGSDVNKPSLANIVVKNLPGPSGSTSTQPTAIVKSEKPDKPVNPENLVEITSIIVQKFKEKVKEEKKNKAALMSLEEERQKKRPEATIHPQEEVQDSKEGVQEMLHQKMRKSKNGEAHAHEEDSAAEDRDQIAVNEEREKKKATERAAAQFQKQNLEIDSKKLKKCEEKTAANRSKEDKDKSATRKTESSNNKPKQDLVNVAIDMHAKEAAQKAKELERKKREYAEKMDQAKAKCAPMKLRLKPIVSLTKTRAVLFNSECLHLLNTSSLKRVEEQLLRHFSPNSNLNRKDRPQTYHAHERRIKDKRADTVKPKKKRRVLDSTDDEDEVPAKKMREKDKSNHASTVSSISNKGTNVAGPSSCLPVSKPAEILHERAMNALFDSDSSTEDFAQVDMECPESPPERSIRATPEQEAIKLATVRRREEQRQKPKVVKLLDDAPPIGRKRSYEPMDSYNRPQSSSARITQAVATVRFAEPPVIDKKEKLRQIEIEKKKRSEESKEPKPVVAKAPVVARYTKKSRSDLLLESVESTLAPTAVEPLPRRLPVRPPVESRPAPGAIMPVDRIINDIENNRLSQVIEKPKRTVPAQISDSTGNQSLRKPTTSAQEKGSSSVQATSEYHSRLAKNLGQAPVLIGTGKSAVQVRTAPRPVELPASIPGPSTVSAIRGHFPQRFPEDAVFRDAFGWSPNWLDEQGGHSRSPPVTGERLITTNLPAYKDYESYTSVFYPLMLLELWANVSRDYSQQENPPAKSHNSRQYYDRSAGKPEYDVGVEHIEEAHACPILNYQYKNPRRDTSIPNSGKRPFWYCFHLTALAQKRGEFNRDKNFGIITVDIRIGAVVERKTMFCFIFTDSELYDEIGPGTIMHQALKKNNSHNFKFKITVVTHINFQPNDVILDKPGSLKKISYIAPKLREFKSLSALPESKLFDSILKPPLPERSEIFNPKEAVNPASLVKRVHDMLNPVQRGIVNHLAHRIFNNGNTDLVLLHGPPGTGKTRTIVALLLQLTQAIVSKGNQKILVCTPSNTAIDEIIRRYTHETRGNGIVKIVRVGASGSSSLKKYSLDEVAKQYCAGASHLESLETALANEDKKIFACKAKIESLKAGSKNESAALNFERSSLLSLEKNRKLYVEDIRKVSTGRTGMDKARNDAILKAHIVFSTLNSCSGGIIQKLTTSRRDQVGMRFTCCIIDEATQATEPESLAPLLLGCEKMLLVGDPNQLPATVISIEAENKKFRQSLFTRMYNFYNEDENKDRSPVMMLTTQYRMHPDILAWPNEWFYENKLNTCATVLNDRSRKIRIRPYLFINVSSQEDQSDKGQISNNEEVKLIKEILFVIQHQQNIDSRRSADLSIGIITPYNDQKKKIIQDLAVLKTTSPDFYSRIEVDTVDSYQGREKDIVLLSCVRTDEMGFLKTPERLNVSLTRAKMSLIILGNAPCLNNNIMWKSLMDNAVERNVFQRIPPDYKAKGDGFLKQCIEKAILLPSA